MPRQTILYAEDDQETRENYALVLQNYFHTVYTVKDGREALALYQKERPDVLLLDINMPYLNGLEMTKIIREKDRETPVVLITAHSDKEKLFKAIPLGLTQYLVKPVKDEIFRKTMLELISEVNSKNIVGLSGDFVWDKVHGELTYEQVSIHLSKKENTLLVLLVSSLGHYVSNELLITEIWYDEDIDESHTKKLAQLVYRLNTKITAQTGQKTVLIENSYALGYRLLKG
ncbi:DNA-binding response regulator RprY [hydrothermal vent metagenome]|uniref:DNA-binding response regulator RprY n=1 Tax=hydrothermal vent metagenome TaxID=652676 RepID=A0A1W1EDU1_9ZZZZ